MQRVHQFIFVASLLALCWFAMMAIHELGHVVGALITGGVVERVVLHPLTISRTDVSPNPYPTVVVWLGPLLGCLIPLLVGLVVPRQYSVLRSITFFFAGFCLLANGAYIGFGAFERIGDCAVMLEHGSPWWTLLAFGLASLAIGFFVWHRLGSVVTFLSNPSLVDPALAYAFLGLLVVLLVLEIAISPL